MCNVSAKYAQCTTNTTECARSLCAEPSNVATILTIYISTLYYIMHSLKAVNDMVNDKNALSVNHTQLNLAESKSHSGIRAECILHMAVSIGVID